MFLVTINNFLADTPSGTRNLSAPVSAGYTARRYESFIYNFPRAVQTELTVVIKETLKPAVHRDQQFCGRAASFTNAEQKRTHRFFIHEKYLHAGTAVLYHFGNILLHCKNHVHSGELTGAPQPFPPLSLAELTSGLLAGSQLLPVDQVLASGSPGSSGTGNCSSSAESQTQTWRPLDRAIQDPRRAWAGRHSVPSDRRCTGFWFCVGRAWRVAVYSCLGHAWSVAVLFAEHPFQRPACMSLGRPRWRGRRFETSPFR